MIITLKPQIEKENITDRGDVFYVEEDICGLSSISAATDFVYGGSNNGWIYWNDETGIVLNDYLRLILEPENDNQWMLCHKDNLQKRS